MKAMRVLLDDVASIINGGAWSDKEYADSGIPVARVTNFKDYAIDLQEAKYLPEASLLKYKKHLLRYGDLTVSTVGSHPTQPNSVVGKPAIVSNHVAGALLNQNAVIVRTKDDSVLDQHYLAFYGLTREFRGYIESRARGAANQVRMSIELLKSMELRLPSIESQRKVAAILLGFFDAIENNARRIAILEEMARRIYVEWFVHFRFPGHEQVQMVESELGLIPDGWQPKRLGELLDHHIGGGWGEETKSDEFSVPAYVIRGTDIPDVRVSNLGRSPLRFHKESNFRTRQIKARDIVFEVSGGSKDQPVGRSVQVRSGLLRSATSPIICASFCRLVRANAEVILPELLQLHFEAIYANREIMKYQTQSTGITNFKFMVFLDKEIVLAPAPHVQRQFEQVVLPLFSLADTLGLKNADLRTTRDLLLPKLISGELDVSHLPEPEAMAA
jgi:type I restriction enzyme S subunit